MALNVTFIMPPQQAETSQSLSFMIYLTSPMSNVTDGSGGETETGTHLLYMPNATG